MKRICLTFDWELFFNSSGTPENCQIFPTNKLLALARTERVPLAFFVDVLQLMRSEEYPQERNRLQELKGQIRQIVAEGHRVELHLHPHWLDAQYVGDGKWTFPSYDRYRLQSLCHDTVIDLFSSGTRYLNEICQTEICGYKVSSFRAGGWCLLPFTPAMKEGFALAEIGSDSSIAPGLRGYGDAHQFDFSKYRLADSWGYQPSTIDRELAGVYEVPISTYVRTPWMAIYNKLAMLRLPYEQRKIYGDGTPIKIRKSGIRGLAARIGQLMRTRHAIFSLENCVYTYLLDRLQETEEKNIVFLSHPKVMHDYAIENIIKLRRCGYSFIGFDQLAKGAAQ